MTDIRIDRQVEEQQVAQDGRLHNVITVRYFVGEDGPFQVSLPKDDFSSSAALAAMEKIAREVRALRAAQ